ncbi:MAG: hypothetical protein IJ868_07325, partial [Prevotella sp.]|nr:hypothetical protein [Prevotella sp.]
MRYWRTFAKNGANQRDDIWQFHGKCVTLQRHSEKNQENPIRIMKKELKKVLVLGSGALKIGQAGE